jgi:hypothetical protein
MSIESFLKNQSEMIFDYEVTQYLNIPKILSKVLETTLNLKNDGNIDNLLFYKKFYFLHSWSHSKEQKVTDIKVFRYYKLATNKFWKLEYFL